MNDRVHSVALIERLLAHKTLGAAPRAELEWLVAHGTLERMERGAIVSSRDIPVTGMFVVLTGHMAIFVDRGAGRNKVMEWRAGDVAGVLPYSRLVTPPGESYALEHTEVTAHRSGPARDDADNKPGPSRPLSAIGTPRAAFHHGPEPSAPLTRGRRYDCSPIRCAQPSRH